MVVLSAALLLLLGGCVASPEEPQGNSARPQSSAGPATQTPSLPYTGAGKEEVPDGGTVSLSVGPFNSLNPLLSDSEDIRIYMGLVCEPLVRIDALMQPVPALFRSWICNPEYSAWEFTLQEDVLFHDGSPVSAADAVAVIEFIRKNGGNYAKNVENIAGCFVKDDRTVQFILREPDSLFPCKLSVPLLSSACLSDKTADSAPVGAGMYAFLRRDGNEILLEKNENFYDPARSPHIRQVRITVYASEYEKYGSDFDLALFYGSNQAAYVFEEDTRVLSYPGRNYCYVALNCNATYTVRRETPGVEPSYIDIPNPLSDSRVRKAIDLLTDREKVLNTAFSGRGEIVKIPAYKGTAYWQNEDDTAAMGADPDAARALLADAGYIYSEAEGRWYAPDGTLLVLDAIAPAGHFELRSVMRCMKQTLEEIGITVNLEELSDEAYAERYREHRYMMLPMQLTLGCWTDFSEVFETGGALNLSFYSNRQVDTYISQLKSLAQPEVLSAGYNAIEDILLAEAPIVGLYIGYDSVAVRSDVLGVSRTDFYAWDPLACFYQWGIEEDPA